MLYIKGSQTLVAYSVQTEVIRHLILASPYLLYIGSCGFPAVQMKPAETRCALLRLAAVTGKIWNSGWSRTAFSDNGNLLLLHCDGDGGSALTFNQVQPCSSFFPFLPML